MEKKTFKNPGVTSYKTHHAVGDNVAPWETLSFPKEEWDMEVTFTRKPKPLKVGDVVSFTGGDPFYTDCNYEIRAIDGKEAWLKLVGTNEDYGHTSAELTDIKLVESAPPF